MEEYQERVVIERKELDEKREKLSEFLETEMFSGLEKMEKERLCRQLKWMNGYSEVLGERIGEF